MIKLRNSRRDYGRIFVFLVTLLLLLSNYPFAAVYGASGSGGYRIFTLKHISAERGREYLAESGIGTVSHIPGTAALLVTGQAEEVAKAKAILDIVDAQGEFAVKVIFPASGVEALPDIEQLAEELGIGTFSNPPTGARTTRAIIGVHKESLVVAAPTSRLERIVSAIEQLLSEQEVIRPDASKIEPVRRGDANEPNGVAVVPVQKGPQEVAYRPLPPADADKTLSVTLPPKLEIVNLLGLVGEFLKLNFMYDPLKIKGEVTLMLTGDLRGEIKVGDLYPLLESVLHFRGFAMTRNGNLVTIVPIAEVGPRDPRFLTDEDKVVEHGDVVVTRVFELEYIDTASAQNLLSGMSPGTSISPIVDAQMLFVTGYAYRMPRVERLLEMIDKPGRPKKFRFRQLKYTMATALAPKVKVLAEQLGTVSITVGAISSATTTSRRLPGESTAVYSARIAKERVARSRTPAAPSPGAAAQAGVYLDADERTNRILMIGFDEQMDTIEELIDTLDVAQIVLRELKLYKIEHVDAEQARKKLQELKIIGGGGASSSSTSTRITSGARTTTTAKPPTSPTTTSSRTSAAGGALEALVEEPLVVVIEATNSLLINATAEQHEQIAGILTFVDAATDTTTIPYVIYPLENQSPEDLASILEKLIQETIKNKEGKIEQVIKKTEEEIVIVPDENTFSIIVYASKKNQEWIASLIKTLDTRRPQVLIDVILVEITKNDKFEYDLHLLESFPDLIETSGVITPDANTIGSVIGKLLGSKRDRFIDVEVLRGRGTGFYGDRHINALLTAMQEKNYGRVLARPKLLVNDNEPGTISTTDTTYVTLQSSVPLGTAGQYTTTEITTRYEGYDAGIQLDITPNISEGDLLRLDITLTRKDFGTITGTKPPDTTSTDIKTIVTVPDGSTIILGGMIKLNQGKGGTKVPLLGDLPFIGALFRSVSNTDLQRRLYIFVKAEIIRPAETLAQGLPDLEEISMRNRMAFEKFEEEFQRYQSFPGLKSRPLEPFRVLDAQ